MADSLNLFGQSGSGVVRVIFFCSMEKGLDGFSIASFSVGGVEGACEGFSHIDIPFTFGGPPIPYEGMANAYGARPAADPSSSHR
jgi:hypothetical protein